MSEDGEAVPEIPGYNWVNGKPVPWTKKTLAAHHKRAERTFRVAMKRMKAEVTR